MEWLYGLQQLGLSLKLRPFPFAGFAGTMIGMCNSARKKKPGPLSKPFEIPAL